MYKYEYLLFDLDNTLLDYNIAEERALSSTFNDLHFEGDFNALQRKYHIINSSYWRAFEEKRVTLEHLKTARFHDLIQSFPPLHGLDAKICSETYLDYLSEQVHPIPGAWELLDELKDKFKMYLVTNGIARVQHSRIRKSGLDKIFLDVIISEEIGYSKPDPSYFRYSLNKLNNPEPSSVLIIGDNLHSDVLGGMKAGFSGCWFNPHKTENTALISPTFTISRLGDLINILTL